MLSLLKSVDHSCLFQSLFIAITPPKSLPFIFIIVNFTTFVIANVLLTLLLDGVRIAILVIAVLFTISFLITDIDVATMIVAVTLITFIPINAVLLVALPILLAVFRIAVCTASLVIAGLFIVSLLATSIRIAIMIVAITLITSIPINAISLTAMPGSVHPCNLDGSSLQDLLNDRLEVP